MTSTDTSAPGSAATRSDYVTAPTREGRYLLCDATVVDVAAGSSSPHQDVLIADGRIEAITAHGDQHADGVPVVDAAGAYLVPGFVDSHAHVLNTLDAVPASYGLMLANGIVGYRQMSANDDLLQRRAAGTLPDQAGAPRLLALCGELLTPMTAATPEQARETVEHEQRAGADFIKAGFTTAVTFLAALDRARELGIPLSGHLPDDLDPREAASRGVRCIEHLGPGATLFEATSDKESQIRQPPAPARSRRIPNIPGLSALMDRLLLLIVTNPSVITRKADADALRESDATFDEARAHELAATFVEHETWQCPTLIRLHTQRFPTAKEHVEDPHLRYMAPVALRRWRRANVVFDRLPQQTRDTLQRHWPYQLRLAKVFADDGVPMLTGTDSNGAGWVIPGFALHDEFDLLAEAGLTPLQVLQAATLNAARFFGRDERAGQVREGFEADLVLLDADPLADVSALHGIRAVVRDGRMWDRAALDEVLSLAEARPIAQ